MRDVFVNLIKAEKARGATIFMSNHMFDELEETCDYVAFIKDGHLIDVVDMEKLRDVQFRDYVIGFSDKKEYENLALPKGIEVLEKDDFDQTITVRIDIKHSEELAKVLADSKIRSVAERKHTLEEFFMKDIGGKWHERTRSNREYGYPNP